MNDHEVKQKLASMGVRLFAIRLSGCYGREYELWIHPDKTTEQWRQDVRDILKDLYAIDHDEGWADDEIFNSFHQGLVRLGYHEAIDVVCDVFEGRVTNEACRIVPDPDHEIDNTGFGHFGFESKGTKTDQD